MYLYLYGLISGKVLAHIIHCLLKDFYGRSDALIEAESLCKLPAHYLLGLLIFLKSRLQIKVNTDNNDSSSLKIISKNLSETDNLDSNTDKILENIDIDLLVTNFSKLNLKDSQTSKELYNLPARGSIITEDTSSTKENKKFVSEVGINILKLLNLFSEYGRIQGIIHIKPMLEVAGFLKKPPKNLDKNTTSSMPNLLIKSPEKTKNINSPLPIKCNFINYEMNLPKPQNLYESRSNFSGLNQTGSLSKLSQYLQRTTNSKLKISLSNSGTAKSLCQYLTSPVHIFSQDKSFTPAFILGSPNTLENLNKGNSKDWSSIENNFRYLSYKNMYFI